MDWWDVAGKVVFWVVVVWLLVTINAIRLALERLQRRLAPQDSQPPKR